MMTRSFRSLRLTVFGALFLGLGLAVLVSGPAGADSVDESNLFSLADFDMNYDKVRALLAKGVNPNVPIDKHQTAVHTAAEGGVGGAAVKNLSAILQAGGDPHVRDEDGNTPLHLASLGHFSNYADAVRVLLRHGAKLHRPNAYGVTPLLLALASENGTAHVDVIEALLAAGARPQTVDRYGLTALQRFAWSNGDDEGRIVTLLIRAGADPNRKDSGGDTPLHAVIKKGKREGTNGRPEVVEALLAGGADPCIRDARGYTPYQLSSGMPRIRRALSRAGGDDGSCEGVAKRTDWPPAVAGLEQQMVTVRGNVQLSKYEVTQDLWEAVMGTNPSYFKGCGQCPVEQVSWHDVQVFLEKLNALTGGRYRLPTESEWAGAVGSGGGAWHYENSGERTHPVGQKAPNELGLYDMKGNVFEWMEDCWEGDCSRRVGRGGAWN